MAFAFLLWKWITVMAFVKMDMLVTLVFYRMHRLKKRHEKKPEANAALWHTMKCSGNQNKTEIAKRRVYVVQHYKF